MPEIELLCLLVRLVIGLVADLQPVFAVKTQLVDMLAVVNSFVWKEEKTLGRFIRTIHGDLQLF